MSQVLNILNIITLMTSPVPVEAAGSTQGTVVPVSADWSRVRQVSGQAGPCSDTEVWQWPKWSLGLGS